MECLIDTISPFNGCGGPVPISGMYLNQLPGIEFANIDGIANADQVVWSGLWNDIQATAAITFRDDVIAEFGKRYQLRQITQSVDLGQQIDITNLTAPVTNVTNGILMETMQANQQCACSNMLQLYVQSVNFYWSGTNGTPSFTIDFQDADLNTVEYTITVANAVPGWNNVWIDRSFAARRLYMLVSGNFDNYVQLNIADFNLDNFGGYTWGRGNGNWIWFNYGGCGCQSRIQGITYDSVTLQNTPGSNTYGLSAIFTTKCTWDGIVCQNKRHFFSSWQHCLAIEYLNYRIHSSRLNRWTTTDLAQAVKLRDLYVLKYRGGNFGGTEKDPVKIDYPGKLQTAITSIIINDYDCCVKSNNYILWREILT